MTPKERDIQRLDFVQSKVGLVCFCAKIDASHKGWKKPLARILVDLARQALNYSSKTYSGDIYYQMILEVKKLRES
jgi:hypothetical protein